MARRTATARERRTTGNTINGHFTQIKRLKRVNYTRYSGWVLIPVVWAPPLNPILPTPNGPVESADQAQLQGFEETARAEFRGPRVSGDGRWEPGNR